MPAPFINNANQALKNNKDDNAEGMIGL